MTWVVVFCSFLGFFCLLVGVMIGLTWADRSAAREAREDRADREAGEFLEELRPLPEPVRAAAAMAWSSPRSGVWPVPELDGQQERPRPPQHNHWPIESEPLVPCEACISHQAWVAHCEQAEDIANGDPAVDVLDVIHADLDRFIASIRAEAGQ